MIHKFAEKIVDLQVKNELLQYKDKSTYVLGYQLLIGKILSIMLMLIVAAVTGTIVEMLIFMLMFIPLRQYAGGFHFQCAEICILFSTALYTVMTIGFKNQFYGISIWISEVIEIIVSVVIWKIAPIDSRNKRLDDLEKQIYRGRSRIILCIDCILYIVAMIGRWNIIWISVQTAHIVIAISLAIACGRNFFTQELAKTN